MKNNNEKKNSILKKVAVFFGAIAASIGIIAVTYNGSDLYFSKARDKYSSDQAYIKSADFDENDNYISMTEANNLDTVAEGKTITISTVDELNKFSTKCNSTDAFLGYSYELISNINYKEDEQALTYFEPIGWKTEKPFSGTFNGNGYEIEELTMAFNSKTGYDDMKFYSMFSVNTGTITNLGLSHPSVTTTAYLDAFGDDGGVSYLCGQNTGTISNSFVVDDRNAIEKKSGITASGGCRIADLCIENKGTLSNNYVVTSAVVNMQTQDYIEFAEIALTSTTSTATNYYLNTSIESYLNGVIKYKEEFNWPNKSSNHGTYISNKTTLLDTLDDKGWYIADTYGDLSMYVGITYGIMRGIEQDKNDDKILYIDDEKDYAYMYELFSHDDYMASNAITYIIRDDIDLSLIPAFSYSYAKGIGATIKGTKGNSGIPVLANGNNSDLFTLYNADILGSGRVSKNAGVNCFGLFNFVTGTIKDLNIVPKDIDLKNLQIATGSANVNGIGVVSGYVEGGTIDNVHVYANISNSTTSKDLGEYYLGGITGILGGSGKIFDSTTSGEINLVAAKSTIPAESKSYMRAIAIGGAVGYIEASLGTLYTVTNTMNITAKLGTDNTIDYSVGGVIGAGYTTNSKYTFVNGNNSLETQVMTSNLSNIGEIEVGVQDNSKYNTLYVSGVIAKHMGVTNQVSSFDNSGKITVYTNGKKTYVSGVENADIVTDAVNNTGITASQFKTAEGNRLFYASAFSNGEEVKVVGSDTNLNYTNVLNINATNGYKSKVDGLYNLAYNEKYVSNSIKKSKLNAQEITITNLGKFAPVLNVVGGSSSASTEASKLYNLRSINFSNTAATNKTLNYAGVALGEYISYDDVRNEGDLTFTLNAAVTGNLTVSGLFNEISSGAKANNLYNAGNITINYTAVITGNIYASGICYSNRNGISTSDIHKYNPSSNGYDNSLIGSINNAINAGEILISSDNFSSITYSTTTILSPNGQSNLGNTVETTYNDSAYIDGSIYASGITDINESVITNAFNIAKITAVNYVKSTNATREINTAGISVLNIGQFAYILNSANDGDIKAYNMSSGATYKVETNAAGISCRNDELENGNSYTANSSNPNSSQVISFTINYGSIYSYNYKYNFTSTNMEPSAKSSGILSMGFCNVINVVNYGNIYGSETASGIFGIVYFAKFASEVSNDIYIANTLNYGNVYILERGYNHVHGKSYDDYDWIEYSQLMSLTIDTANNYSLTSVVRNTEYISVIGSVFSIINFGNASNTNKIKIRYLISFNEDIAISGAITAYSATADPDVSSFYSAHIKTNALSGAYETDRYMGKFVQYSPLSSNPFSGTFVTEIDANDNVTTATKTYEGVFSNKFAFEQAIKGNASYLDITNYKTDIFISDYFEFIGAVYANDVLLKKIGWSDITYRAAAESFATSLDGVAKFVTYVNGDGNPNHINTILKSALSTDTWLSKCDNSILIDLTNTLLANEASNENEDILLTMLDYIFASGSSSYSLISTSTRNSILELILESDNALSYSTLLDRLITYTGGYSNLLADSVLNNDDAGQYLQNYISSLTDSNIETILTNYCNYLKDASDNSYFTYKNSEQIRYDLLNTIFENINDNDFYQKFAEILEIDTAIGSSTISDVIKMYEGYNNLQTQEKIDLYKAIITNNTSTTNLNTLIAYIDTMASDIGYYSRMVDLGYSKTSLTNIYNDVSYNASSTSESVIDERVKLWNQIRNTDIFNTYLTNLVTETIYDLATEYNNTYQSITEPHNNGAYIGETSDNRLSYIYTTNITPQVYFYGPYINSNGDWFTSSDSNLTDNEKKTGGKTNNEANAGLPDVIVNQAHLNVGANTDRYFSVFHSSDEDLWTSTELMKSRGGKNSTTTYASALTPTGTAGTATYPTPMLLYYDYNNEQLGGANTLNYTLSSDYYSGEYANGFVFSGFGGSGNQQFKYDKDVVDPLIGGTSKYKTNDWTGTLFAANDYYMRVSSTGELFSLNHAVLARAYNTGGKQTVTLANGSTIKTNNYRFYIQDSDGAFHLVQTGQDNTYDANATIQIGRIVNDTFTPIHTFKNYNGDDVTRKIYSFISYIVGLKMYTSCVSYNMHSTGRTGIYRRSGGWNNYFTWKQSKKTRVFTSQYIDYSVDDLLNLDGYLTEYSDGTYKSTDERNLINRIFNEYLVGDYTQFSKVVAAALLERNMYDSNYEPDIKYINEFFTSNIYSTTLINNEIVPLEFIYQSWTSNSNKTTVKKYLTDLVGNNPDYKTLFIAYCTSNQSAYAKLLLELIKLNVDIYDLSTILARGIGSSSDSGAMTIPNVSSYNDVSFVDSSTTINSENMQYGLKFDDITFSLNSAWKKIYIYCKPTDTSGTLNIKIDSDATGTDYTVTASNNNYIEVNLNNNSSLKLSANNDVILYKVLVNYDENVLVTKTVDTSFNIRNSTAEIQTNMSVTIPTLATIENNVINELTTNNISYSNLVINNVTIDIECYNAYNDDQIIGIGLDDQTMIQYTNIAAYSSYKFNTLNGSTYYGTTINAYYRSRPNWYQYTDTLISKCDINVNYSYDTYEPQTTNVELLNNTSVYTCIQNSFTNEDICNKTLDESTNYSTKYGTMIKDALYGLLPIDYSSILDNPTHSGAASKNIIEILGLSETHNDNLDPEYCVPDFIKLFITASNTAFKSFIDESVANSINKNTDYGIILRYLVNNIGYYSLNDAIKSVTTINSNSFTTKLTPVSQFRIAAAFIVSDYKYILNNSLSIGSSILKYYIDSYMISKYQYISTSTYDYNKFEDFCHEIGYDLSTAGYGIYALASNQGKLNGQFIPDNLNIISMDDNYSPETIEETSILTLNDLNTSYWRGGDEVIEGNVNYAFYKDMKQVEKSISTAILEISIEYDDEIIYGDVDIDDEVITFYVSGITTGNYDIKSLVLAYEAKTNKNVGSKISVTSTSNNVTQDSITITAEEEAISKTYSIKFVKLDTEFDLKYSDGSDSKTLNPTNNDTTYTLTVTSTVGKELPEGLNLEHFIKFDGINNDFDMSSEHISLSVLSTDHRVDSNGKATITVIVSNSLPADTYKITLSISGVTDYVTLIKVANTGKEITEFGFDGELRTFDENYELKSTIPFGRAYNYEELKDNTSENFYLYAFKYSSNATLVIDVSKSIDESGLMTYLVQYSITAEAGGQPRVYKHYIKENQFFDQDSDYASVFADGETVKGRPDNYDTLPAEERVKYLNDGTFTYDLSKDICIKDANDNCTWDLTDDMKLKVAFNRGYDPQYRIKYNLANFYTLGANVVFGPTAATLALEATVNNTYAGLTITVSQNNDVGTYTFVYTYTNTGVWENNVEYTRYYEFPELVIEKIASTDALLWGLTFLEEAIALGNTATVVYPTRVVVPDKSDTTVGYNDTDIIYDTAFTSTTRDIVVSSTGIRYKNGTSATTIKDYFAVGTVSNADLQYYCPGFEINEYAEMYQYTTLAKLKGYGSDNNQKTNDLQLLTNHETTYLYIPFNKDGEITNYLVELDSNGYWTNVYLDTFDGTNASTTLVHTYASNTVNTHNAKREGSITGIGRVDASAGLSTSNQSLYMNYVGNPVKGHFWYVSYVIFSEDYLTGGRSEGNIRYYHISIIDTTNTIQFNVTVYAENSFSLPDIYLTISENIYKLKSNNEKEYVSSSQISAYAIDTETTYSGSRTDIAGYKIYTLRFNLQTLPAGYFYFYVDLPDGYEAVAHTDMVNQLILYNTNGTIKSKDQMADVEVGSFLPFTSIITQYVDLEIVINRGTGENSGAWAINTTDIYTRQAEYEVLNP